MSMSHENIPATLAGTMPNTPVILVQLLSIIAVTACSTRLMSGWNYTSELSNHEGTRKIATIPYWIPYLGHLLPLTVNPSHFLDKCRFVDMPCPAFSTTPYLTNMQARIRRWSLRFVSVRIRPPRDKHTIVGEYTF